MNRLLDPLQKNLKNKNKFLKIKIVHALGKRIPKASAREKERERDKRGRAVVSVKVRRTLVREY